MNSFISTVVAAVLEKQLPLTQITVILPSHRAGLFVKEAFKEQCNKTTFLPKIISIEQFIEEVSELETISNLQLIFEFYEVYKTNTIKEPETFDQFYEWASVVLNDFNEIDRHLINPKNIFQNLSDLNRIQEWNPKTPLTTNYINFFDFLKTYYFNLYEQLLSKKKGYQGMLYRESVQNIQNFINNHQNHHFVFAGFNALNKAEEVLFQELLENNLATVYWDINQEFFDSPFKIGYFLKKYKENWNYYKKKPFLWVHDETKNDKEIHTIAIPKSVSQLKYTGELLQKLPNFNKTALILADENLLSVALNSLPENVKEVNITMGAPLHLTPVKSFFESLFILIDQKKEEEINPVFYYKDVINFFEQPYLLKLTSVDLNLFKIYFQINFIEQNKLFISKNEILELIERFFPIHTSTLSHLFEVSNKNISVLINNIIQLINKLIEFTFGIEREYFIKFHTVFQELETLNNNYQEINSLKILQQLFKQIVTSTQMSFHGEPLNGLQIMGVLESRALDFKTIIITGVNEGVLPKGSKDFSFIPFDIKIHFGLPTFLERDIIFSYHFFRLLQRAEKVFLIYNGETDILGGSEKSRFLTQLEIMYPKLIKTTIAPEVTNNPIKPIQINKTPEIILKIENKLKSGISPSALATYVRNPVEFYQKYVLDLFELKEVETSIEASTFGNIIHEVLENLYTPFILQKINKESIKLIKMKCQTELELQFLKHYKKGDLKTGKNKLITEVAKKYIDTLLHLDLNTINNNSEIYIIDLEKELKIEIFIADIALSVVLKGKVDRIDMVNNNHRIIDYKTGKVTSSDLKLKNFENIGNDEKQTKTMQLLLYAYMYLNQPENKSILALECGNISFKNLHEGFIKVNISNNPRGKDYEITLEKLTPFITEIEKLIKEILNPEIPFVEKQPEYFIK